VLSSANAHVKGVFGIKLGWELDSDGRGNDSTEFSLRTKLVQTRLLLQGVRWVGPGLDGKSSSCSNFL